MSANVSGKPDNNKSSTLPPAINTEAKQEKQRFAVIKAGGATLKIILLQTKTAELIWRSLPLFSICETWGASIHFECPVHAGRERTARLNVSPGDVCYWSEDNRVILGWGPTPISRPNEIRLMRPCNIWARVVGDTAALQIVTPGEKVSLQKTQLQPESR